MTGAVLCLEGMENLHGEVAEDAVVEGGLVLVDRAASAGGRVGPVHLVRLPDLHADAVLPVVGRGELDISAVVVAAAEPVPDLDPGRENPRALGPVRPGPVAVGPVPTLVELARGVVLGSQVPVHVHGAHGALEVVLGVGLHIAPRRGFPRSLS